MSVVRDAPTSCIESPGLVEADVVDEGRFTIPDVLEDADAWYCFETVERDGGLDKIPCAPDPRRNRRINGHDPKDGDVVGFQEAYDAVAESRRRRGPDAGLAGVMLSLSSMEDLSVIDLDGCVDPDSGEITDFAAGIVDDLSETFWEISPSSTGLHGYLLDSEPLDDDVKKNGAIEVYTSRGVTFTGRKVASTSQSVSRLDGLTRAYQRLHNSQKQAGAGRGVESNGDGANSSGSGGNSGAPNDSTTSHTSATVSRARENGLGADEFRRLRGADVDTLPEDVADVVEAIVEYTDDGCALYEDGHSAPNAGGDRSENDASLLAKLDWWMSDAGMFEDDDFTQADLERAFLTSALAEREKASRIDYVSLSAFHVRHNELQ